MAVYVEDGQDIEQNRLIAEHQQLSKALEIVGRGFLGMLKTRRIKKEIESINRAYQERAYQLGLEARYRSGSHG